MQFVLLGNIAPALQYSVLDQMKTLTPEYVLGQMRDWLANYRRLSPQKDQWAKFVNDSRKMWMTRVAVPENKLRLISSRVLIILGDHDIIRPEHGLEMHRMIKKSEFAILPGTSHSTFAEKPELVNRLTIEFFTKK